MLTSVVAVCSFSCGLETLDFLRGGGWLGSLVSVRSCFSGLEAVVFSMGGGQPKSLGSTGTVASSSDESSYL